jgi:superfamily II DNA helicase RecQ
MKNTVSEDNVFNKNLCVIAMDEAHTIWGYRRFRKQFKHVGKLRTLFPNVPFAALSATFPPHIVAYVRRVCNMKLPTNIITVNGRRSNIDLLVMEQHSKSNFDQLLELIPSEDFAVEDIPQTLVFVDSVIPAIHIARALREKLSGVKKGCKPQVLVRTYYATLDQEKKLETEKLVENGQAKIVICTDSLSLGVDFSNIDRVIQWGVDDKLTMDALMQRIGRAARDQLRQGVAIVYAPFALVKSIDKDWERAWGNDERMEDGSPQTGNTAKRMDPISHALLSLPVSEGTVSRVAELKNRIYRTAEAEHDCLQELHRAGSKAARSRRRGVDPGVLWFLGTVGCRHRCLLSYMDYPDVMDDGDQQSWCCDNCAISRGGRPLEEIITAGFSPASSITLQAESQKPKAVRTRDPEPLRSAGALQWKSHLEKNMKLFRTILWKKLVDRDYISCEIDAEAVLSTEIIEKLAESCRRITSVASMERVLRAANHHWENTLLRKKDIVELFNVFPMTFESVPLSQGNAGSGCVDV